VRGTGIDDLLDLRPYPFWILDDLICPEAHHAPTFSLHCCRATSIPFGLEGMMIAINFDHELARYAGEVREVGANRMLSAELRSAHAAIPQELPHLALCSTTVATEFTCPLAIVIVSGHDPLT
jgi:hypothetical protein